MCVEWYCRRIPGEAGCVCARRVLFRWDGDEHAMSRNFKGELGFTLCCWDVMIVRLLLLVCFCCTQPTFAYSTTLCVCVANAACSLGDDFCLSTARMSFKLLLLWRDILEIYSTRTEIPLCCNGNLLFATVCGSLSIFRSRR